MDNMIEFAFTNSHFWIQFREIIHYGHGGFFHSWEEVGTSGDLFQYSAHHLPFPMPDTFAGYIVM